MTVSEVREAHSVPAISFGEASLPFLVYLVNPLSITRKLVQSMEVQTRIGGAVSHI